MRSTSRATRATLLCLFLVGVLSGTALAWDSVCNSGEMCNFSNGPFVSPIAASSSGDNNYSGDVFPGTQQTLNDSVSSIRNLKTNRDVVWYVDAGYRGALRCLDAGYQLGNLGSLNDKFSSHLIAANDTC